LIEIRIDKGENARPERDEVRAAVV